MVTEPAPSPPPPSPPPPSPPRPRVAILGAGVVGGRLARELVSSHPELGVSLHTSTEDRRRELRDAFGADLVVASHDTGVEAGVEVVVLAGPQSAQVDLAGMHLAAGRHVVAVVDGAVVVGDLLALDERARHHGRSLVVGSGFSPGLTCLLARHAVSSFDTVDEVRFARHGAAGPLCAASRLEALRSPVHEWRDGEWVLETAGSGRELCWFPDPVGGADAYRASTGEPLLAVDALDDLGRASARMVLSRWDRVAQYLPTVLPPPHEGGVGAVRVEIRGSLGGERRAAVFGALDRPGVAAAAVCAEVVLGLLAGEGPTGAHGLAAWEEAGEILARLRIRGVRVAELDGA